MSGRALPLLDELDEFSRSFAEVLFRDFPAFTAHASAEQGVLTVELSPGIPRPDLLFYVSTDREEITIGLGLFHTHFDWPARTDCEPSEDPIAFLRALCADALFIVDRFEDGKWVGSETLTAEEAGGTIELEPGEVAHVRSWSGAGDRSLLRGK